VCTACTANHIFLMAYDDRCRRHYPLQRLPASCSQKTLICVGSERPTDMNMESSILCVAVLLCCRRHSDVSDRFRPASHLLFGLSFGSEDGILSSATSGCLRSSRRDEADDAHTLHLHSASVMIETN
jgi:hypothetical protein